MKEFRPKYRIKTKKEFITELGAGWRDAVMCSFVGGMDYLLGKELTKNEEKEYLCLFEIDGWSISKDMITEIKPKEHPSILTSSLKDSLYRRKRINLNQND